MMERQDLMIVRLNNIEKDVENIMVETSEMKKEQDSIKDEERETGSYSMELKQK